MADTLMSGMTLWCHCGHHDGDGTFKSQRAQLGPYLSEKCHLLSSMPNGICNHWTTVNPAAIDCSNVGRFSGDSSHERPGWSIIQLGCNQHVGLFM